MKKHTPAVFDITRDGDSETSSFLFKACQPAWGIEASKLNATIARDQVSVNETASTENKTVFNDIDESCKGKANAYIMTGGKCVYSFSDADFDGLIDQEAGDNSTKGFTLTYKSTEPCTADKSKKFSFKINAVCSKESTVLNTVEFTDGTCEAQITKLGAENCKAYSVDFFPKFIDAISPYLGFILIVLGGGLAFAGAKLILLAFTILVSVAVSGGLFMMSYNLFIPTKSSEGVYGVVLLICVVIGGVLGYLSKKFAKAWATTLLATWVGFVAMSLLVKIAGIYNNYAVLGLSILGAVAGGFLGKKLDKHIKSFGTAFIGAYLLIRGIGTFAGGYPSESELAKQAQDGEVAKYNPMVWAYFAGFIFFAVAGAFVQLKYLKAEEEDKKEDAFENEDEAKVCGCL